MQFELRSHFNFVFSFEWLFSGAEKEHDTTKRPAINLEVGMKPEAGLWCTPLFESCTTLDLLCLVVQLDGNVEVYNL